MFLLRLIVSLFVGILSGFVILMFLDAILPHGKGWQFPVILFGSPFLGGLCAVKFYRMMKNETQRHSSKEDADEDR